MVDIHSEEYILGQNIRKYRLEKGWSQKQLSDAVDIDRADISKYENGKQYITDNIFSCACAALCRAGAFCVPDFETKCPEVRCRSPPLLHFVSDQPRTN